MDERTERYVLSDARIKEMRDVGLQQDSVLGLQLNCMSDYTIDRSDVSVIILRPIVFSGDQPDPVDGMWQVRFPLKRCGESKYYNVIFAATPGRASPIGVYYVHPGTSLADAMLMRDANQTAKAMVVAKSGSKACPSIYLFDVAVLEQPHDVVEGGATFHGVWREEWTFLVCGAKVKVPMRFVPDANGGGTSYLVDDKPR